MHRCVLFYLEWCMTVYGGRLVASDYLIFFPLLFFFLTSNVHYYFFLIFDFVINTFVEVFFLKFYHSIKFFIILFFNLNLILLIFLLLLKLFFNSIKTLNPIIEIFYRFFSHSFSTTDSTNTELRTLSTRNLGS